MQEEIITSENITRDLIRAFFEQAFFNTGLDDNGVLFIKEKFKVYIDTSKKVALTFNLVFRLNEQSSHEDRLELVNTINRQLLQIKAILSDNLICLEYDLWIDGGVVPKNVILAYRNFVVQINNAINKDQKKVLL